MSMVGIETLPETKNGERSLGMRVIAKAISILAGLARKVVDEVVYTIREELYHGRIEREPEDWER